MIKSLTREITLMIQTRTGASAAVLVWFVIMAVALVTAFVFLCAAGYEWLAMQYGYVTAGLAMAGIFVVIAIVAAIASTTIRRRNRERAILARAAKAHAPSWLLDPRILGVAMEAGRTLGWQRIVPMALLGFLASQWARERRDNNRQQL